MVAAFVLLTFFHLRNLHSGLKAARAAVAPGPFGHAVSVIGAPERPNVEYLDEQHGAVGLRGDIALPSYWTNAKESSGNAFDQMVYVKADSHAIFNELLTKTYRGITTQDRPCPKAVGDQCSKVQGGCACVRPGGVPGLPTGYVVRRVIRVEDSGMWGRYVAKRSTIRAKHGTGTLPPFDPPVLTDEIADNHPQALQPLEQDLNEVYLWHGTGVRTALAIAQNDFSISLAGSSAGTMYGRGVYMAESSTKADEYSKDEQGTWYEGIFALLLVRACLGKYFYTTQRDTSAQGQVSSGAFDSTLGDRAKSVGTYREFVVYDADQIYPEFVVLYSRIHQADDELAVRGAADVPFHMELPVYWSNMHRNPTGDTFAAQYKVRPATRELLQHLVSGAMPSGKPTVVEASRIEDSEMWACYVQFKAQVQSQLLRASNSTQTPELMSRASEERFRGESDEYASFCKSGPLAGKVASLQFEIEWKDQDWGNKKGRIRVFLQRGPAELYVRDIFGVCRADGRTGWKKVCRVFNGKDNLVANAQPGDRVEVQYLVGGGGGHELYVRNFRCMVQYEDGSQSGLRNSSLARCKPPNEIDGKLESGHALTAQLLNELDAEDCISSENLDSTLNEMYLWHGTTKGAAEAISQGGFRIPREERAKHGKRFGEGAYFAEDLSKSVSYAVPEDDIYYILLCRTTCGELHYTEENSDTRAHARAVQDGKNSILANPNGQGPREFIVLEESQVYPEFIIKMRVGN